MKTMMTHIMAIFFFFFAINLGNAQEKEVMTGYASIEEVIEDPDNAWFMVNYNAYMPSERDLKVIQNMPEDYEIVAIGGLWCPVSRKHIPQLYRITDIAAIPRDRVKLHLVDMNFKSEEGLADEFDIEGVPTFIIMKDGKEVDRIMIYEEETIEESLAGVIAAEL